MLKITFKYLLSVIIFLSWAWLANAQTPVEQFHLKTRWAKDVSPENVLPEYPRPQMERKKWLCLNGTWSYAITPTETEFPSKWDGNILVPYPVESALSGVMKNLKPMEHLWYKRKFAVDALASEKVLLHFGAVDYQATVWINGKQIGEHEGGYTAFTIDVTTVLKKGENEILVKVFDPGDRGIGPHGKQVLNPANIYYTASSGIWQTVWLEVVPDQYITSLKIIPEIDKQGISLIVNTNKPHEKLRIEAIVNKNGKPIKISNVQHDTEFWLSVTDPTLWSPENPFLYDLQIRLLRNGKVVDKVKSYFGMRKISIAKDKNGVDRIFLNNRPYYNLGTLDQGFWPDGLYTAPTDEALAFDIKAIKAMGFNTIRKHIKVEPDRWYYHADKIGMLVWQDFVNPNQGLPAGSKESFEKQGKEMLSQLQNHPCISTWVLFNEKWGAYDQERLTRWVKALDPTRLVNGHSGEYLYVNHQLRSPSPNAYIGADMTDVHSYPNPMLPERQANKAMVCGEFGGVGVRVPNHEWNDLIGWGYIDVSAGELKNKYREMIDSLLALKKEGLSGSIYTQPFDVEGEENGLMTYDREIIKIPIADLRKMNEQLLDVGNLHQDSSFNIAQVIDTADNDNRYPAFLNEFAKGRRDSSFLRRLTILSIRKKDQEHTTKVGNEFIKNLHFIYSKPNLVFIKAITKTSADSGFQLFLKNPQEVDAMLGNNSSINLIRTIITREEITPYMNTNEGQPDWSKIKENLVSKYGEMGLVKYSGERMLYAFYHEKWNDFCLFYKEYFRSSYTNSEYHINNMSWCLFEHCSDTESLKVAENAMNYTIAHFDSLNYNAYDTYANILYKLGKKDEAIIWLSKASKAVPDNTIFSETLKNWTKQ